MNRQKGMLLIGIAAVSAMCAMLIVYAISQHREFNSGQIVNPNVTENILPKDILLKYLRNITGSNTISGLFITPSSGADLDNGIETINRITGVSPALLERRMPKYSDNTSIWRTFTDEVISKWKNGYLVHIIWGFRQNPLSQMDIFKATRNFTVDEGKWRDLIENDGPLNKAWKEQLDNLVPHLQQLQLNGVVPIFSPIPDINEKSVRIGRPGVNGSLKLYQITYDYLTKHHRLNSIIWNWHLQYQTDILQLEQFWPGENYVDVVTMNLGHTKHLSSAEYNKFMGIVGDKPTSFQSYTVPTTQLLNLQPKWTWFAIFDKFLTYLNYNNDENVNSTFHSTSILNKGDIDFFNPHY